MMIMLSRLDTIPERDRRTYRTALSISRVSTAVLNIAVLTRDNERSKSSKGLLYYKTLLHTKQTHGGGAIIAAIGLFSTDKYMLIKAETVTNEILRTIYKKKHKEKRSKIRIKPHKFW